MYCTKPLTNPCFPIPFATKCGVWYQLYNLRSTLLLVDMFTMISSVIITLENVIRPHRWSFHDHHRARTDMELFHSQRLGNLCWIWGSLHRNNCIRQYCTFFIWRRGLMASVPDQRLSIGDNIIQCLILGHNFVKVFLCNNFLWFVYSTFSIQQTILSLSTKKTCRMFWLATSHISSSKLIDRLSHTC